MENLKISEINHVPNSNAFLKALQTMDFLDEKDKKLSAEIIRDKDVLYNLTKEINALKNKLNELKKNKEDNILGKVVKIIKKIAELENKKEGLQEKIERNLEQLVNKNADQERMTDTELPKKVA